MRLAAALAGLAFALAACGFQLRGTASLPFETIYVPNATSGIALEIKRSIQAGSNARVVDDAKAAAAQLQFSEESRRKEILSLTAAGRVSEYRLFYRVGFRVSDGKGGDFLPPVSIQLYRDMTYDDSLVLAKEEEELLLFRDMQRDMVQQVMRRIAGAKPAKS
jgi:LPS-assembly lipoprotein